MPVACPKCEGALDPAMHPRAMPDTLSVGVTSLSWKFAACAGLLTACAASAPTPVIVHSQVSVVILPSPDQLPFDPSDARLAEATSQLSALAGHPVVFEFDVALLPDWRSDFQAMLIESIENVAHDLDALKTGHGAVFAHGVPLLERVVSRYDAQVPHSPEPHFDPAAHALVLVGPANHWGVERGYVEAALEDEYARWIGEHFATARARDLPASDQATYFDFLTDFRIRRAWAQAYAKQLEGRPREPDAEAVVGVVDLSAVVPRSAGKLNEQVRKWILRQASEFADAYNHEEERVAAQPAGSMWRRAEGAWVGWLNAHVAGMTAEEKRDLLRHVFVRTRGADGQYRASPTAFPGFDRFAFGLAIADAWARSGHARSDRPPAEDELYEATLCVPKTDPDGREYAPRCDYEWYRDALDDPATTRRLTDALLARKDLDLTRAVLGAIASMPRGGDKLASLFSILNAFDVDDAAWEAAFRVVADRYAEGGDADRWLDLARRVWPGHAARHPVLLYALVQVDRYGDGDKIGWSRFAETFGAPLDAKEFAAYLDQGGRAWSLARVLWPALSRGWSRGAVLVPRLDAYLSDTRAHAYDYRDPGAAIHSIATRLCEEGDIADMAQLAAYFRNRTASHPGESYAQAFEDQNDCKGAPTRRTPSHPTSSGTPLRVKP
jgi:hypothetical protein